MDIHRFTELANAYGAARGRWPEDRRALYDRFAATPEGQAVLADAGRIDGFLDGWHVGAGDAERAQRIVAAALANPQRADTPPRAAAAPPARAARSVRLLGAWLSTGFAASALLGFVLGYTQASASLDAETYSELLLGSTTVMEDFP